VNLGKLVSETS